MNAPRISVIVPVYNVEKYLPRCIDSILAQTFTDFELLLIDDGSKDKSGEICDEYSKKDNRIRVFHRENGGPSKSRNFGIYKSLGEWIVFIDSDDYVSIDYIETFFKYNDTFDENIQVIQGCHIFSDDDQISPNYVERKYLYTELYVNGENDRTNIRNQRLLHSWEVWDRIFSKKIIEQYNLNFNEKVKVLEDAMFWHRYILKVQKIIFVPEQNYYYNTPILSNSITHVHKMSLEELIELVTFYKEYSNNMIETFSLDKEYANEIYGLYINRYRYLCKQVLKTIILLCPTTMKCFKIKSLKILSR